MYLKEPTWRLEAQFTPKKFLRSRLGGHTSDGMDEPLVNHFFTLQNFFLILRFFFLFFLE